ncbi:MAG TPA: hypothetical protein VGB89_14500 [Bacteroidota bacterium]|jgi:DNA-binding NtrC family response regulator
MNRHVLLVGRKESIIENVKKNLHAKDVTLHGGTSIHDVREVLEKEKIDLVIMGAGLDMETRCEMVKIIFSMSNSTTVHMKDEASGPEGMLPFVRSILVGNVSAGRVEA